MQLNNAIIRNTGPLMQAIDVLGYDGEGMLLGHQARDGDVTAVRLAGPHKWIVLAPLLPKIEPGDIGTRHIAGSRDLAGGPHTIWAPVVGQSTLGTDTCVPVHRKSSARTSGLRTPASGPASASR